MKKFPFSAYLDSWGNQGVRLSPFKLGIMGIKHSLDSDKAKFKSQLLLGSHLELFIPQSASVKSE